MKFSKYDFISFTVTIASPGVFTAVEHELYEDDVIRLETTGTLYTGLAVKTDYYVVYNGITADTFQVATTKRGTPVNTSGSQSGAHTWIKRNVARVRANVEDNK